jgi:hypothetical protein
MSNFLIRVEDDDPQYDQIKWINMNFVIKIHDVVEIMRWIPSDQHGHVVERKFHQIKIETVNSPTSIHILFLQRDRALDFYHSLINDYVESFYFTSK